MSKSTIPDAFILGDPNRDKIIQIFYQVFIDVVPSPDPFKCGKLALEIETFIKSNNISNSTVKSKFLNLKMAENNLCFNIYYNNLSIRDFFKLTSEQMKTSKMTEQDRQMVQEGIDSGQIADAGEETDIFKCFKCNQRTCRYRQLQTRSADEPMTTFVVCRCGNAWKC